LVAEKGKLAEEAAGAIGVIERIQYSFYLGLDIQMI